MKQVAGYIFRSLVNCLRTRTIKIFIAVIVALHWVGSGWIVLGTYGQDRLNKLVEAEKKILAG